MEFIMAFLLSGLVFSVYMLIRGIITFNFSEYWIDVIYFYQIHCINSNKQPLVDFEDIKKFECYFWDMFTFSKYEMLKNPLHYQVLKPFEGKEVLPNE